MPGSSDFAVYYSVGETAILLRQGYLKRCGVIRCVFVARLPFTSLPGHGVRAGSEQLLHQGKGFFHGAGGGCAGLIVGHCVQRFIERLGADRAVVSDCGESA